MITYEFGYRTGSGNEMPLMVHGELLRREAVPVIDNLANVECVGYSDNFASAEYLCQRGIGCKGKNGGCPPYSPHFGKFKPSLPYFYVIAVEFDMAGAIKYSGWWKGVSAPGLYILVYADRLMMNYTQRALRFFENVGYYTLGVSNCPGCRPRDCAVMKGERCNKPRKRRFSIESVGVMCNELHLDLFGEALPWWFHTKEHMPAKMVRYAGVFTDKPASTLDDLLQEFILRDKSYIDNPPIIDEFDVSTLEIPSDCYDAGYEYDVYRVPVERMATRKKV